MERQRTVCTWIDMQRTSGVVVHGPVVNCYGEENMIPEGLRTTSISTIMPVEKWISSWSSVGIGMEELSCSHLANTVSSRLQRSTRPDRYDLCLYSKLAFRCRTVLEILRWRSYYVQSVRRARKERLWWMTKDGGRIWRSRGEWDYVSIEDLRFVVEYVEYSGR